MDAPDKPFVLIIEDDSRLVQWTHYTLRQAGFETLNATSPEEGLHLAVRVRPDVILCDMRLPRMHGSELLAILKADPATAPIPVVLFGSEERLFGSGDFTYLRHPIDTTSLISAVSNAHAAGTCCAGPGLSN